jgi:ribulose-phosphate 3-epimerase
MDGRFVPNFGFGPGAVRALRGEGVFLDAHLMVSDPGAFGPAFVRAGADWVVFHAEACPEPGELIGALRRLGAGVGMAVRPASPVDALLERLPLVDIALVMTVEPGFGGQRFMEPMLSKVRALRSAVDRSRLKCWVQVDGGVNAETAVLAARAGADSLVAGSAVFEAGGDPARAALALRRAAQRAFDGRR